MKKKKLCLTVVSLAAVFALATAAFFFLDIGEEIKAEYYQSATDLFECFAPYLGNFEELEITGVTKDTEILLGNATVTTLDYQEITREDLYIYIEEVSTASGRAHYYVLLHTENDEQLMYLDLWCRDDDTIINFQNEIENKILYISDYTPDDTNEYIFYSLFDNIASIYSISNYIPQQSGTSFSTYWTYWNKTFTLNVTYQQLFQTYYNEYCDENNISRSTIDTFDKFNKAVEYGLNELWQTTIQQQSEKQQLQNQINSLTQQNNTLTQQNSALNQQVQENSFATFWATWNTNFNNTQTWQQVITQQWYQYCVENNLSPTSIDSYQKFRTATQYYINVLNDTIGDISAEYTEQISELQDELTAKNAAYEELSGEYEEIIEKYAVYEGMDGIQGLFHSIGNLLNIQIFGIIPLYAFVVIPLILAVLVLAFKLMR